MNIDFIKWMCDKAEGFEAITGKNRFNCSMGIVSISDTGYFKIIYPLLLQRAIEGVNKDHKNKGDENPILDIDCHDITVWYVLTDNVKLFDFDNYDDEDKAKESALMYIYEQEKENGR